MPTLLFVELEPVVEVEEPPLDFELEQPANAVVAIVATATAARIRLRIIALFPFLGYRRGGAPGAEWSGMERGFAVGPRNVATRNVWRAVLFGKGPFANGGGRR
jgi:hypothetical protein